MTTQRDPGVIDDYASAVTLSRQLDASTPFKVRPGKPLLKFMKEKGTPMSAGRDYLVDKVLYSGDEGGIMCMLQSEAEDEEVIGASLTHLIIDPAHPLAEDIKAYQRQRTYQLKLQDERGFAALARQAKASNKRRKKRGFGG